MRELLMEEYQFVAGGNQECEDLAEDVQLTTTLDGILVGAASAMLFPGGGTVVGGVIAAAALLAGSILGDAVEEACQNHMDQQENLEE